MNQLKIEGILVSCKAVEINQIFISKVGVEYFPQVIVRESENKCICPSPLHGRSLIANFNPDLNRYIITKGNGLTYFPFGFISTGEMEDYAWGLLRPEDAIRDFKSGNYINKLGILTNNMEAVYKLEKQPISHLKLNNTVEPTILQYNVHCPYRIADMPFLSKQTVLFFIEQWSNFHNIEYSLIHCNAADILISNIRKLHDNGVLHNSIHIQNYTLSLELVDFELSRTPDTPYDIENEEHVYKALQNREIIQSLEIVNHIAYYFDEILNYGILRKIMTKYGYEDFLYES